MTDEPISHTPRGGAHAAVVRAAIAYGDLSYDQVRAALGVSTKTLTRWASGEGRPKLEQRIALARLAGVPPAFLEDGFDAEPASGELTEDKVRALIQLEVAAAMRQQGRPGDEGRRGPDAQAS